VPYISPIKLHFYVLRSTNAVDFEKKKQQTWPEVLLYYIVA